MPIPDCPDRILRPMSAERQELLRSKLRQYEGRLPLYAGTGQWTEDAMKIRILKKLLDDGQVDRQAVLAELQQVHGFNRAEFDKAYYVVYDYAATGGRSLKAQNIAPPHRFVGGEDGEA